MITNKPFESTNRLADQAAQVADHAIKTTQQAANSALDTMADGAQSVRQDVAPLLSRASEQASALAHRGVDAVRESSQQLRESALRASDSTVSYIKDEPIKAMLIAAATGAALMSLLSLMSRARDR